MSNRPRIKKKATEQVPARAYPDPTVFGVPAAVFLVEKICTKCWQGVMRPAERRVLTAADKGPQRGVYHECTNPDCTETMLAPHPYPHPDFNPNYDAVEAGPAIGPQMKAAMERRAELAKKEGSDGQE